MHTSGYHKAHLKKVRKRDTVQSVHAELFNIDDWATENNLRLHKSKSREMVVLRSAKGVTRPTASHQQTTRHR